MQFARNVDYKSSSSSSSSPSYTFFQLICRPIQH